MPYFPKTLTIHTTVPAHRTTHNIVPTKCLLCCLRSDVAITPGPSTGGVKVRAIVS